MMMCLSRLPDNVKNRASNRSKVSVRDAMLCYVMAASRELHCSRVQGCAMLCFKCISIWASINSFLQFIRMYSGKKLAKAKSVGVT